MKDALKLQDSPQRVKEAATENSKVLPAKYQLTGRPIQAHWAAALPCWAPSTGGCSDASCRGQAALPLLGLSPLASRGPAAPRPNPHGRIRHPTASLCACTLCSHTRTHTCTHARMHTHTHGSWTCFLWSYRSLSTVLFSLLFHLVAFHFFSI